MQNETILSAKNKRGSVASALAVAVFLIGGELLAVGRESVSDAYSSGLALIVSLLFVGAAGAAAHSVFSRRSEHTSILQGATVWLFGILAAAAAVFVAIESILEFSDFAADVMLLRAPKYLVALTFLAFCAFLASKGGKTVTKYALLSAVLIAIETVALILLSLPAIDPSLVEIESGAPSVKATAGAFVKKFAPLCIPIVYLSCEDGRLRSKALSLSPLAAILGIITGGAILTLCHFNVTLLLGSALARTLTFPYSAAMSAISTGKLFMRMEGISYVLYFLAASTRASVAIGTVITLSKRLLKVKKN